MNTQISLNVLFSIGGAIVGSVSAYIRLKSKIDRLEIYHMAQEKEMQDVKERKRELSGVLHTRIDDLTKDYDDLQKEVQKGHQSLETKMAQMELRIVREIQKLNR